MADSNQKGLNRNSNQGVLRRSHWGFNDSLIRDWAPPTNILPATAATSDATVSASTVAGATSIPQAIPKFHVESSFEGTNGVTVGTTDDIFNGGSASSGSSTVTYSSTWARLGQTSLRFFTFDGTFISRIFDVKPLQGKLSWYWRTDTIPVSTATIINIVDAALTPAATLRVTSTGAWRITDANTAVGTSSASEIAVDTTYRLEWEWSAITQTQTLRVWKGANLEGVTPDVTLTGDFNVINGIVPETMRIGWSAGPGVQATNYWDAFDFDSITARGIAPVNGATVAATTTVGTPTVTAADPNATVSATTVAATATVGTALVTPAPGGTVAAVATVGAITFTSSATFTPGVNMMRDTATFDTDITGWQIRTGTLASVTWDSTDGNNSLGSLRLDTTSTSARDAVVASAGRTTNRYASMTASAWVKTGTTTTVRVGFDFQQGSVSIATRTVTAGVWTRVSHTTSPVDSSTTLVSPLFGLPANANDSLWVDDVQLEYAASVTAWTVPTAVPCSVSIGAPTVQASQTVSATTVAATTTVGAPAVIPGPATVNATTTVSGTATVSALAQHTGNILPVTATFDTGITGWSTFNGPTSVTHDAAEGNTSLGSLKIVASAGTQGAQVTEKFVYGRTFTVSAWVKSTTQSFVAIGTSNSVANRAVTPGVWTRINYAVTNDVNTRPTGIAIASVGGSDTIWVDDVQVEYAGAVTAWKLNTAVPCSVSIPTPTVPTSSTVAASTVFGSVSIPAGTGVITSTLYPATLTATTSVGTPTVTVGGGGDATVTASTVNATTTVGAPQVIPGPATVTAVATVAGQWSFTDNFNRANGDPGNGWTANFLDPASAVITSNRLESGARSIPWGSTVHGSFVVGTPLAPFLQFKYQNQTWDGSGGVVTYTDIRQYYTIYYSSDTLSVDVQDETAYAYNFATVTLTATDVVEYEIVQASHIKVWVNGTLQVTLSNAVYSNVPNFPYTRSPGVLIAYDLDDLTFAHGLRDGSDATIVKTFREPATVAATATVGAPTVQAGSTVSVSAVNGTTTVGAPGITLVAGVNTVAGTTTIGAPVLAAGTVVAASVVAGTATVGTPTLSAGTVVIATTVPGTTAIGAPVLAAGSVVTVNTVAGTTTVGAPTLSAGSVVAVAVVATRAGVGVAERLVIDYDNDYLPGSRRYYVSWVTTGSYESFQLQSEAGIRVAFERGFGDVIASVAPTPVATLQYWSESTDTAINGDFLEVEIDLDSGIRYWVNGSLIQTFDNSNNLLGPDYLPITGNPPQFFNNGLNTADSTVRNGLRDGSDALIVKTFREPATVAGAATVGTPTVQTSDNANVSASTVNGVTSVGVPTLAAGAVAVASTVSGSTTVGAPGITLVAGVNTVTGATTIGAPTVQAGSVVTVSVVNGTTTVGAPVVQASQAVTAATVNGTATVGAPQLVAGPATVNGTATVGVPVLAAGSVATVAVVAGTTTVGAPQIIPGPATVTGTTTIGAPTVAAGATVTVSVVNGTTTTGQPGITLVAGVNAVVGAATVGAPTLATGSTVTTATVNGTTTVGAVSVFPGPATVTGTATIGAPTLAAGAVATVNVVAGTTTVGAPQLVPGPATVTATATVGAPTVAAGAVAIVNTVNGSTTVGAPGITLVAGVSTVAGTATIGAPALSTGSTVTTTTVSGAATVATPTLVPGPATVTGTASVGAPTLQAGAVVTTSTVNGSTTVNQPGITLVAGVNTVVGTATVGAPTIEASQTVSVATVNGIATVGAPTLQASQTASASTVNGSATVGGSNVQPAQATTVTATAAVGVPSVLTEGNVTISVATVNGTAAVGAPTIAAGSVLTVSTVTGTATVGAPTVQAGSAPAPSTVAGTATVGAPTLATGVTVSTSTVNGTTTIGAPGITLVAGVNTVTGTTTVGAPTLAAGSTVTVTTVSATAAVGAPDLATGSTISASTVTGSATVSEPGVTLVAGVSTVTGTATVDAPTLTTGSVVTVATVDGAATVGSPTIQTTGNTTAAPATVNGSASVPIPTVQTASNATVAATTVTATSSTDAPTLSAGSRVGTSTVFGVTTIPAPVSSGDALISGQTVNATTSVTSPTESAGSSVTATTVAGSTTIPQPAPQIPNVTIGEVIIFAGSTASVAVISATATIATPTTQAGTTPSTTTIPITVAIPVPNLLAGSTVLASTVAALVSIPGIGIANSAAITVVTVDAVASVDLPTLTTRRTPFRGWGVPIR